MAETFTGLEVIEEAFRELGVIVVGETLPTAIANSALKVLNGLLSSTWVETAMNPDMKTEAPAPNLTAGIITYTVGQGPGGPDWILNYPPIRILSWRAASGSFRTSGLILPMQQFRDEVGRRPILAQASVLPELVGGEALQPITTSPATFTISYRLEVWPTPATSPGTITLDYFSYQNTFALTSTTLIFPDGWFDYLTSNLALSLAPSYPRVGGVPEALAAKAQRSKGVLVDKNAAIQGLQKAG